jgi:hypothetical protein
MFLGQVWPLICSRAHHSTWTEHPLTAHARSPLIPHSRSVKLSAKPPFGGCSAHIDPDLSIVFAFGACRALALLCADFVDMIKDMTVTMTMTIIAINSNPETRIFHQGPCCFLGSLFLHGFMQACECMLPFCFCVLVAASSQPCGPAFVLHAKHWEVHRWQMACWALWLCN